MQERLSHPASARLQHRLQLVSLPAEGGSQAAGHLSLKIEQLAGLVLQGVPHPLGQQLEQVVCC